MRNMWTKNVMWISKNQYVSESEMIEVKKDIGYRLVCLLEKSGVLTLEEVVSPPMYGHYEHRFTASCSVVPPCAFGDSVYVVHKEDGKVSIVEDGRVNAFLVTQDGIRFGYGYDFDNNFCKDGEDNVFLNLENAAVRAKAMREG